MLNKDALIKCVQILFINVPFAFPQMLLKYLFFKRGTLSITFDGKLLTLFQILFKNESLFICVSFGQFFFC